jgi:hypothetical protein
MRVNPYRFDRNIASFFSQIDSSRKMFEPSVEPSVSEPKMDWASMVSYPKYGGLLVPPIIGQFSVFLKNVFYYVILSAFSVSNV